MKKLLIFISMVFFFSKSAFAQNLTGDIVLNGYWKSAEARENLTLKKSMSPVYVAHAANIPKDSKQYSFGGALNLKYFTGLAYDYFVKNLRGKTITLSVNIPNQSVSPDSMKPNRLRISLKSERNGQWVEYNGEKSWTSIKEPGVYNIKFKVPSEALVTSSKKIFYPEYSILLCVELYLMEGSKYVSSASFSISNFFIEDIPLNPDNIKWQVMKNGYVENMDFLTQYPRLSMLVNGAAKGFDLVYEPSSLPEITGAGDYFLTTAVDIPDELRVKKGAVILSVLNSDKVYQTSTKTFKSANREGKIFFTIPLDNVPKNEGWMVKLLKENKIHLRVRSSVPHDNNMPPIVIEPLALRKGWLIPFDSGWKARDVQGLGGYNSLEISRRYGRLGKSGIAARQFGSRLYELNATVKLKGGIDWSNPYYRVELIRYFDKGPVNMNDKYLEVFINPLTNTTDYWQVPYRARLGIMDKNNNVMFGPNVSLSEGLPSLASLEVSMSNPIPKGFVMPGFDPENTAAVIINLEATHAFNNSEIMDISFINLSVRPNIGEQPKAPKTINFSGQRHRQGNWEIRNLINNDGGFSVGINYPFPVVKVSADILEVPQVYPPLGKKATDTMHLGFSSKLSRQAAMKDFTVFANNGIGLVRLFILGHLEGIFTWDAQNKDITINDPAMNSRFKELAGMDIESFAEFLNNNENTFFKQNVVGEYDGIENHVLKDFTSLLDILEKVERLTGKRVMLVLSMFDFLLGDGIKREGPARKYAVGEHPEAVLDPVTKAKVEALTWKILKIIRADKRFQRYVALVEVMNEPGNATVLSNKQHFSDLADFNAENLYLFRDALGADIPVSIGFRSWPLDLKFWPNIKDGIDVLMPHYWESLESYNIDQAGLWPLDMPPDELWNMLGANKNNRLTGIGEISPGGDIRRKLFRLEKAGYDFALVWSYSGHDGHDAKPVLANIRKYQESNLLIEKLKTADKVSLKKSFIYIDSCKSIADAYLNIKDGSIRTTVIDILEIFRLKDIDLDSVNLEFIRRKILG